jgi:hypothetical protein
MAEPIPAVTAALKQASEAISALKKTKPKSKAQARAKAAEMIRIQQEAANLGQRVSEANAQTRVAGAGNGHASATYLSDELMTAIARALVPFLKETVTQALVPAFARIVALEEKRGLAPLSARLAGFEQQLTKCLKDGGTWKRERSFDPGDVTTYRGQIWVCQKANSNIRPGTSDDWRLMEKKEQWR